VKLISNLYVLVLAFTLMNGIFESGSCTRSTFTNPLSHFLFISSHLVLKPFYFVLMSLEIDITATDSGYANCYI
jgi:hypothetical protein